MGQGTRRSCADSAVSIAIRCGRSSQVATVALRSTATAAFQPKLVSMKALSQPQAWATMSTGGAA